VRDSYPCAAWFLAERAGGTGLDPAALDGCLQQLLAAGRAAWPAASLDDATFIRHVARRAHTVELAALARLHAGDLYLACACVAGDPASILAFERRCLAPLPKLIARNGITAEVAEEVVQALGVRLFVGKEGGRALIGDYDGRGALGAWVRVAAVRLASNLRRDETNRAALAVDAISPASLPVLDPALALIKRRYGDSFQAAIRDAFAALDHSERNVLRLHLTDGLNLDAIARVLGVSRATAGRRLLAARTRVREQALHLLGERIVATPAELESLLEVVRSTLDLSLAAFVS
jgi:RNA polymerase sigma-70 factor, ECF subfamily